MELPILPSNQIVAKLLLYGHPPPHIEILELLPLCWTNLDTTLPQYTHTLTQSPPSGHKLLLRPREGLIQRRRLSSHCWLGSIQ